MLKRLQILIEPELDERLAAHAKREGMSKGAVVRELVRRGVPAVDVDWERYEGILGGRGAVHDLEAEHRAEIASGR